MLFKLHGATALIAALFALALAGASPAMAQSDTTQDTGSTTNGDEKPAEGGEEAPPPPPEPDC